MAGAKDVILSQLQTGQFLIDQFTPDLSDEEYFEIPVAGANHAAWLMGHLAVSEDGLTAAATGGAKIFPDTTHEKFRGGSTCHADASKFPSRREIDEMFKRSRAHTVEALQAFDERRWGDPSPKEMSQELFPTLGAIWTLQGTHQFWHIGHLTVCRAALKKARKLM
jgi:hypothetical protein